MTDFGFSVDRFSPIRWNAGRTARVTRGRKDGMRAADWQLCFWRSDHAENFNSFRPTHSFGAGARSGGPDAGRLFFQQLSRPWVQAIQSYQLRVVRMCADLRIWLHDSQVESSPPSPSAGPLRFPRSTSTQAQPQPQSQSPQPSS